MPESRWENLPNPKPDPWGWENLAPQLGLDPAAAPPPEPLLAQLIEKLLSESEQTDEELSGAGKDSPFAEEREGAGSPTRGGDEADAIIAAASAQSAIAEAAREAGLDDVLRGISRRTAGWHRHRYRQADTGATIASQTGAKSWQASCAACSGTPAGTQSRESFGWEIRAATGRATCPKTSSHRASSVAAYACCWSPSTPAGAWTTSHPRGDGDGIEPGAKRSARRRVADACKAGQR